jgi:hypothetical protein
LSDAARSSIEVSEHFVFQKVVADEALEWILVLRWRRFELTGSQVLSSICGDLDPASDKPHSRTSAGSNRTFWA